VHAPETIEIVREGRVRGARRPLALVARRAHPNYTRKVSLDAIFSAGNTGAVVTTRTARSRSSRGASRVPRSGPRSCRIPVAGPLVLDVGAKRRMQARLSGAVSRHMGSVYARLSHGTRESRAWDSCRSAKEDTKGNSLTPRGACRCLRRATPSHTFIGKRRGGRRRVSRGTCDGRRHRWIHRQTWC